MLWAGLLTGVLLLSPSRQQQPPAGPGRDLSDHRPVAGRGVALADPVIPAGQPRELVVLVHGLGRTWRSMSPVARALRAAGYEVHCHAYRSRRQSVELSGRALAARIESESARPEVSRVHLVGHSLGNIVIRWAAAHRPPAKLGRIVMLAPPNGGSRWADRTASWLSWLSVPLSDLTTSSSSAARSLPGAQGLQVGIIAASRDHLVREPDTHLAGEQEHVVVPSSHTFIMNHVRVHDLTLGFLRDGTFGS